MRNGRNRLFGASRWTILGAVAGVTAGAMFGRSSAWAQGAGTNPALTHIDPSLLMTPEQAWDWNMFKAQVGPTYAGSSGWKRYTDFLLNKMQEFGVVDIDHADIPYDHYIVDDWPDRRTHIYDSGMAVEKLVTDGTPFRCWLRMA